MLSGLITFGSFTGGVITALLVSLTGGFNIGILSWCNGTMLSVFAGLIGPLQPHIAITNAQLIIFGSVVFMPDYFIMARFL